MLERRVLVMVLTMVRVPYATYFVLCTLITTIYCTDAPHLLQMIKDNVEPCHTSANNRGHSGNIMVHLLGLLQPDMRIFCSKMMILLALPTIVIPQVCLPKLISWRTTQSSSWPPAIHLTLWADPRRDLPRWRESSVLLVSCSDIAPDR